MSTRDQDYYYSTTTTFNFTPDPINLGKFIEHRYDKPAQKVRCEWCKSGYSRERDHCPNCGGPQHD